MELIREHWDSKSYGEFTDFLLQNKKEGFAEFAAKMIPTKYKIIGVPSPIIGKIIKQIAKGNFAEFIACSKTDYYEQIAILGQVITSSKCDCFARKKYLTQFIPLIDNWAVNDVTCCAFKSLKKENAEYCEFLKNLLGGGTYSIRFALCCFMNYYLTDDAYVDEIFKFVNEVTNKDYYVMMMQAWLIATAFVKQREKTLTFLKNNKLEKVTQNKAIQKMRESFRVSAEDKQMLLSLKK